MGMVNKKMEATISDLGFRLSNFRFSQGPGAGITIVARSITQRFPWERRIKRQKCLGFREAWNRNCESMGDYEGLGFRLQ